MSAGMAFETCGKISNWLHCLLDQPKEQYGNLQGVACRKNASYRTFK